MSEASQQAKEALNRACEGHDVVGMGNRAVDLVPRVSVPTMRQVDRTVDRAGDAVQEVAGAVVSVCAAVVRWSVAGRRRRRCLGGVCGVDGELSG
ncbi:hypothetical protein IAQ61_011587 [Plenodomus lingam]|uniref:uncharacterized protein n=1 Tax=Leptosphaeria maculans TaxID=5022 RepID=UPI00332EDDAB|nr:hypothetical protein IAQ61_011587 [Plenodomus lingam]